MGLLIDMAGRVAGPKSYFALSGLLHVALIAVLLLIKPVSLPRAVTDQPISVEIVAMAPPERKMTTDRAQAASRPERTALTQDKILSAVRRNLPKTSQEAGQEVADPDAMIAATQMYSAAALADRRSAGARMAMRGLGPDERIIQLCNVEAMEQVHRWKGEFEPDSVVAYATATVSVSEHGMKADGAAIHSKGNWFSMRFTCDVSADGAAVLAFSFRVGQPIPRADWPSYSLATHVDAAD